MVSPRELRSVTCTVATAPLEGVTALRKTSNPEGGGLKVHYFDFIFIYDMEITSPGHE